MKMYHFWGVFRLGQGNPPPPRLKIVPTLAQLFPFSRLGGPPGGPITLWIDEILPPHLCSVCFITFMDSCKANLVLGNFAKKLGFGQTPPPWLVQKTNFSHFFFWRLPLSESNLSKKYLKKRVFVTYSVSQQKYVGWTSISPTQETIWMQWFLKN